MVVVMVIDGILVEGVFGRDIVLEEVVKVEWVIVFR